MSRAAAALVSFISPQSSEVCGGAASSPTLQREIVRLGRVHLAVHIARREAGGSLASLLPWTPPAGSHGPAPPLNGQGAP